MNKFAYELGLRFGGLNKEAGKAKDIIRGASKLVGKGINKLKGKGKGTEKTVSEPLVSIMDRMKVISKHPSAPNIKTKGFFAPFRERDHLGYAESARRNLKDTVRMKRNILAKPSREAKRELYDAEDKAFNAYRNKESPEIQKMLEDKVKDVRMKHLSLLSKSDISGGPYYGWEPMKVVEQDIRKSIDTLRKYNTPPYAPLPRKKIK